MEYLIDTNIAYYLSDLNFNFDSNFDIHKFKKDDTSKIISSISILELYLKNNIKDFKIILKGLYNNNIGIVVYGNNLKENIKPTIKKLYTKPKSYLIRMINYLKERYLYFISINIMYLGLLIGAMYTGLLELKSKKIKLKEFTFNFICFRNNEDVLNLIKESINKYFSSSSKEDCDNIFYNVRVLTIMAIANYKDKINGINNKVETFSSLENIELNCYQLMRETCGELNIRSRAIIDRFNKCLGDSPLDFSGLKQIVEYCFLQNKLNWNDFADFTIIRIAEKIGDCSAITSDKIWQEFIKTYSKVNDCANLSYNTLLKFYKKVGY